LQSSPNGVERVKTRTYNSGAQRNKLSKKNVEHVLEHADWLLLDGWNPVWHKHR